MKKFLASINWKYFVFGLLIVIGGNYVYMKYFQKSNSTTSDTGQIVIVKKGNISQTIKALGSTELLNDQKIRFNQVGTISKVNVKQGDRVKAGQLIAQLDMKDLNNSIKQNEIDLSNSRISLQQLLEGNDKSQILSAQANVDSTKSKINTTQISLTNLKKEKSDKLASLNTTLEQLNLSYKNALTDQNNYTQDNQYAIDQAKRDLENKKQAYELAKKDLENTTLVEQQSVTQSNSSYNLKLVSAIQELKNGAIDGQNIINNIDFIFGFTDANKTRVLNYDVYLGAKDSNQKTVTKSKFTAASAGYNTYANVSAQFNINDVNVDKKKLIAALYQEKALFNDMLGLCNSAYDSVNNSIATINLTQSQIDSYLSNVSSYRNTTQTRITNINNNISNIESLQEPTLTQSTSDNNVKQKQQSVNSAKLSMDAAQQNYDSLVSGVGVKNTSKNLDTLKIKSQIDDQVRTIQQTTDSYAAQIKSLEFDLENYQRQFETSQASLAEIKRGSKSTAIQQARNNIQQKELMLEKQKENIKDYQILAPFDGRIMSIDFKVGDNLASDSSDVKYVYIQNPNIIMVNVLLDQVDIVKIQPGMSVTMNFYAYPDDAFTGSVYQINGIPQTSNGVTSYQAKIYLNTNGKTFYSGMTQNVVINVNTKKDVLLLPVLAVQSTGDVKNVILVNNGGGIETKTIKTGITDGTNIEITEGLNEGDKVKEKTYNKSSTSGSTSSSSSRSSSRSMMGGPGPM